MNDYATKIHNALKKQMKEDFSELAELVKETMVQEIEAKVYKVYPYPKVYDRNDPSVKHLNNKENMPHFVSESDNSITLTVKNTTEHDGKDIASLVEKGHGYNGLKYDYPYDERFTDARPFMESTEEMVKDDAIEFIKDSVRKVIKNIK